MAKPKAIDRWKNTSDYPDEWAKPAIEWVAKFCGRTRPFNVEIRRGVTIDGSGRAWTNRIFLRLNRRRPREQWKDTRFRWDQKRETRGALESFIWLAAHEMHHITDAGRMESRNLVRSSYEFRANNAGTAAVEAYRAGPAKALLAAYRKAKRRERDKAARQRMSIEARRAKESSVDYRLTRIDEKLEAWGRKTKRAERAISKLRRQRSAIIAAQKRKERVAAKS